MTDRKNLKVDPDVFERLKEQKGDHETWDGYLLKLSKNLNTQDSDR